MFIPFVMLMRGVGVPPVLLTTICKVSMRSEPLTLTGALITADEHTAPGPMLHVAAGVVEVNGVVLGTLDDEEGSGAVEGGGVYTSGFIADNTADR